MLSERSLVARCLRIAEGLCGPEARAGVFEPMLADWQREWQDARGAVRFVVLVDGASAFLWSLARCWQPAHQFVVSPGMAITTTLVLFGAAGAFLALQPIDYRWFGAGLDFSWHTVFGPADFAYFVPFAFATTLAFALLPAMMLATIAHVSWRGRVVAILVTLAVIVVIEGFIAPAAMYARHREFINRIPQEYRGLWMRNYENTADVIAAALSDDEPLAQAARLSLRDKSEVLGAAVAFALLGIAVGRTRTHRRVNTGLLAVGVWWFGAWFLYNALDYWSQYVAIFLSVSRDAQPWLAAVIFVAVTLMSVTVDAAPRLVARRTGS